MNSDSKIKELLKSEKACEIIDRYLDNLTKDTKTIRTCTGMTVKGLFKFISIDDFSQEKRDAMVAELDALGE